MPEYIDGWQLVQYLVMFIAPILVGLITKHSTSASVKAVLLALIAAVTAVGTEALDAHAEGAPFVVNIVVFNAVVGFTVAVASHFGLWKPTGVSDAAQDAMVKDSVPASRGNS